jgi:hypothetical protein
VALPFGAACGKPPPNRVFKNKHQAVSQGVRRFGKRSPPAADEHLQKPHNASSRPQVQFFNTLLKGVYSFGLTPLSKTISPPKWSV